MSFFTRLRSKPVADDPQPDTVETPEPPVRSRVRVVAGAALTVLACALVWFALVGPNELSRLTPLALVRIPLEGLVILALLVILPAKARRIVAAVIGALLGLLTVVKFLDMGFIEALDRPFNPITDWGNFGPGIGVLTDSIGHAGSVGVVILAIVAVAAVLVFTMLATVRLSRIAARHRATSLRTASGLGLAWVLCAVLGLQFVSGTPLASTSAAGIAYEQGRQVSDGIADQAAFAKAVANDNQRNTPTSDLLTGLRGKDVMIAFVESYGQVAVQGSFYSPQVDDMLNNDTATLAQDGWQSQSAFLTSPTFGGISWLAHSTLQSGLWIDNQQRYNELVKTDRYTLSDAFKQAGWRTVVDVPSDEGPWPVGTNFYHYDKEYDHYNTGYAGPRFSYATMPDQYTLSAFQNAELTPGHQPIFAELDFVSSHTPWAPLPSMVPWNQVGDGTIFTGQPEAGQQPSVVWKDPHQVQAAYGQSVEYSVTALVSWVETNPDPNLVLVMLGDHQPATIVSGEGASHNVPISIISRDPSVMQQISSWNWQNGLLPSPDAPVWQMDAFRDKFLDAYNAQPPLH